ncbi:MAG TPA: hypothetical protein DDX54_05725 [Rhodospirillaceae bacterium]|jgi:hypothetical protein|nr:hypothetical protein [Alphaproteobacteria bacterium]HBH26882.1 hypothetical protein [Rhodospirillaceae bacterium]
MDDRWPLLDDSLAALVREAWAARWAIAMGGALGLAVAVLVLFLATPRYAAEVILSPASPLSSAADPAATPNDNLTLFLHIYAGPSVARTLLKAEPKAVARLREDRLFPLSSSPLEADPEAKDLSAYLKRQVVAAHVGNTALTRLTYVHPDPDFATAFLEIVRRTADDRIRDMSRSAAAARTAYLGEALARTANVEDRRALAALLMEQEHITMLTAMGEPFAARVVEPAAAAPRPVWPRTLPTLLVLTVLGGAVGFAAHLWRAWARAG